MRRVDTICGKLCYNIDLRENTKMDFTVFCFSLIMIIILIRRGDTRNELYPQDYKLPRFLFTGNAGSFQDETFNAGGDEFRVDDFEQAPS